MTDEENDRYRAPALDKGLDILELLAAVDGGLTQAEIAKRLDRSPNEFYRMLDRLVKRGYVTRIDGDRFSLTLKLFGLAQLHAPVRRLVSFAVPLMRELAETSRQANQLVVFDRGNPVVIAQQEAPGYWGISIRVGSRIGLFDTGSGHALLAFRSPEERLRMIAEHVGDGGTDVRVTPEFLARLDLIRSRGYEMMPSAQTAGVINLSAPVLGADGRAIAALTIPYITLINAPVAPDISTTIQLLGETTRRLSEMAGAGFNAEEQ
ncbi:MULTISPECIES: IclR family transcriptional regulator [unclassified Shinella]|uniref:IclR family transcriptional regulator n=1 Tax=unclassified Shinella TaxID=2643062 RepID=UPI0003C5435E|nr:MULTISPECIES: IclR family transcriptional regulator [unclassified Shinella]MCA0340725.1 IclR family transcriptional regulator [Pseudomonadota bacterium]EYR78059.1 transcriptional regulator, IclR family [Shinella sp. DD12]KNY15523.1 IclR family transcriptional regulator [Shinella sp. SUS2]KOC76163.1 IclR family transcriptional regulator [Shinella sp. GWS1]MCO5153499.1 IclR family transcriptional regulator [Shinella sp.]